MLTRIEVNGFKNLIGFEADFSAFNCIAGLNGVGKSNIFDAIKFMSLLAEKDLHTAAMSVRDVNTGGDVRDIFLTDGVDRIQRMEFAVEMLVSPQVVDDFSRTSKVTSTYLRYSVHIKLEESTGSRPRLALTEESLTYISKSDASRRIRFPCSARDFRDRAVVNDRRATSFISTSTADDGVHEINIHQDGGSSGKPQKIPAFSTPRTVVANTNSIEHPTILAAKREMMSWRFLALEPSAMRRSNSFYDPTTIDSSGGYLASTLFKLSKKISGIENIVARKLNEITKISDLRVDEDVTREILTLVAKDRSGAYIPARGLSDGTLRFLALCIMSEDPDYQGLLCFEEPENGIHPAKMNAMLDLLKDLVVDLSSSPSVENPMRQMIIATHSPAMVQLQDKDDLIFADVVSVLGPFKRPMSTVRCKPLAGTWRSKEGERTMNLGSILSYLAAPEHAQLSLEMMGY